MCGRPILCYASLLCDLCELLDTRRECDLEQVTKVESRCIFAIPTKENIKTQNSNARFIQLDQCVFGIDNQCEARFFTFLMILIALHFVITFDD